MARTTRFRRFKIGGESGKRVLCHFLIVLFQLLAGSKELFGFRYHGSA